MKGEPQDRRMNVDSIGDYLASDVGPLEDRRQRAWISMVQGGHRIEKVSDMGDPHVEAANGLVIRSLRVTEGSDRSVVHQGTDCLRTSRQLRRDRHHLESIAEQSVNVIENGW